jgi:hypothetical protein
MRVLVLVPTAGSLIRISTLKARPDLPASVVVAAPSYIPMPITREYDVLTSEAGPLAAVGAPVKPGRYWLRLSGEVNSGESWEIPVILAHLVFALGVELVEQPSEADVVLWSTGEVDAKLNIVDRNYRVPPKVARSRTGLHEAAAAGAQIIGILPAGEDDSPLRSLLADVGVQDACVEHVASVAAARKIVEQALGRHRPGHRSTVLAQHAAMDLSEAEFISALEGLRADMREFAAVLSGEANIDERFQPYISHLADGIVSYDLNRLRVVEGVFVEFSEIVEREWPGFLAAYYRALKRQIQHIITLSGGQTVPAVPPTALSGEHIAAAAPLTNALREAMAQDFVDERVPAALEELAQTLRQVSARAEASFADKETR